MTDGACGVQAVRLLAYDVALLLTGNRPKMLGVLRGTLDTIFAGMEEADMAITHFPGYQAWVVYYMGLLIGEFRDPEHHRQAVISEQVLFYRAQSVHTSAPSRLAFVKFPSDGLWLGAVQSPPAIPHLAVPAVTDRAVADLQVVEQVAALPWGEYGDLAFRGELVDVEEQ